MNGNGLEGSSRMASSIAFKNSPKILFVSAGSDLAYDSSSSAFEMSANNNLSPKVETPPDIFTTSILMARDPTKSRVSKRRAEMFRANWTFGFLANASSKIWRARFGSRRSIQILPITCDASDDALVSSSSARLKFKSA